VSAEQAAQAATTGRAAEWAAARDAADPLAGYRSRFVPVPAGVTYLAGHSVGRPAVAVADAMADAVAEWAQVGHGGWRSGWARLPADAGDAVAELIGAEPGEVVVCDSTTAAATRLASAVLASVARRAVIVIASGEFPSLRYAMHALAGQYDARLRVADADPDHGASVEAVEAACAGRADLVVLSHVSYRSAAMADLAGVIEVAHDAGALVLWDLSHSVGVAPVRLADVGADLAVGCTYKHLGAGPGSPAFLYVRSDLQQALSPTVRGWFGHADPLAMVDVWQPADGVSRHLVSTPQVIGCAAVAAAARLAADAGVDALAAKSQALSGMAIDLADSWLGRYGMRVSTPRARWRRGAHVALRHPRAADLVRGLADAGVVVDHRPPDVVRIGCSPLTTSYTDVHTALTTLYDLLLRGGGEAA
jgi:kynureninase